jgi:uncharacterized membrane protein YdjX (TVP38/TMEM64 family)
MFSSKNPLKFIFFAIFAIGIFFVIFFFDEIQKWSDLNQVKKEYLNLKLLCNENLAISLAIFVGVYAMACFMAVPITTLLTLGAGAFFPFEFAIGIVLFSRMVGFSLAFWCARLFLKDWLYPKIVHHLKKLDAFVTDNPLRIVLTLRFFPVLPSALVTFALALNNIPWSAFWKGSLIAMIPMTCLYCSAGSQINKINDLSELFTLPFMLILAGLAFLPWLQKWMMERGTHAH